MQRIGLIGLGNIGKFYAERLRQHGYPLTVLDLDAARVAYAVGLGAQAAASPGEVARQSAIILLSLPGSHAVEQVMEGPDGLLAHLQAGQVVVDTGTSRPETDIHYARRCQALGAAFLDAPLTYRRQGQIIMVGGAREDFARVEPVLTCLSYKLRHVGDVGEGQVLKLINQAVLAGRLAVYAEAVELAKVHQIDPRLLKEFLEFDIPEDLFGDDFSGGGHLALHYKDLGYLLELAHASGAQIPISSLVHEIFKTSKLYGAANWKQPGIITYWRRLNPAPANGTPSGQDGAAQTSRPPASHPKHTNE
ncbi:MAG TPA: NAD(P)-dependent oxidoreductase [Caldilineaceae bacterium]|nr:NAD(P)-dependent oxidoreductase [Caldilineaceae bacterium]